MNKFQFNGEYLSFWFQSKAKLFKYFRDYQEGAGKTKRLFFDNGGQILLVAHLDTVYPPLLQGIIKNFVMGRGLDDRLGCMLVYELQQHYINADVLLCDYEEMGRSTAQYHDLKNYNFIVELDREGQDFVSYGMAGKELLKDFENTTKLIEGWGSFSDISFLKTDIGCINLGIGLYQSHDKFSFAIISEVNNQINKLLNFCKCYIDKKYTCEKVFQLDNYDDYPIFQVDKQ